MAKSLSKVTYKPDSQSTEEYIVLVDTEEFKKWKEGGISIPLASVVDSFQVLYSATGAQGILGTASKQQLDTTFGTTKDVEVVEKILKDGKHQSTEGVKSGGFGTTNVARGSGGLDTKGKSNTSGI
ncbi:DUF1960-domain-containing protein [Cylindrobasidium torrendii FP15055 ss-10]|uniref:DUF1960-domain-containing protein n=1 Tax=Cylindrobasidium torrendii FP15055 ss-10 TaxID=1314674 RepID=A0A0D7BWI9_9AGAR|nr:DUF1960-domain-containing protein [Cylindrobasidium torrendii FP15055 ss-10]